MAEYNYQEAQRISKDESVARRVEYEKFVKSWKGKVLATDEKIYDIFTHESGINKLCELSAITNRLFEVYGDEIEN